MCGICGVFSPKLSREGRRGAVAAMVAAMSHRGPDGTATAASGPCALGHARLAVIDTTETGNQPMFRDGVYLVYNGELYNFQDERLVLEKGGFRFVGSSDAEVLLAMYLVYGKSFLARLRGMYAFAIYDSRDESILCARDPLGIKPFLYAYTADGFIFASELKALLASHLVTREVDRGGLHALIWRGSVPQPGTMLSGVKWLLPGYCLTVKSGHEPAFTQFYKTRTNTFDFSRIAWPDLLVEGKRVLQDSLKRQMISDVPLGAFLSGGIDSSLLVALMAQTHENVRTFSVGFEGGLDTASEDETDDAEEVARFLGVKHTLVVVRKEEIAENLRAIAKGLDHPTVDGVNSWFVARAARRDLTVAISGTGGDELFAGYPWFAAMAEHEKVKFATRIKRRIRGDGFMKAFDAQYRIFEPARAARILIEAPGTAERPDPLYRADVLSRVTGALLSGYTRDQLLADVDTAAMWNGLEVRVPFLDERVLEFALSLPPEAKLGPGDAEAPEGSYARTGVKRLLMDIGKPLLPRGFAARAKRGFTLPFDGWLRGQLQEEMRELLDPETVRRRGFFDPIEVSEIASDFKRGGAHWTRPWLLMMTELWAQEVLDA
jgi:asparagine synthase (glutamine-hydrolysing)